ncbi:hypothetical protein Lser_V15G22262 [Lactuca serriola]
MAAVTNGFSYTGHKQTLTLDWKSILKKCDDFSGPVNGFMFVDFNSIIEQTCPRDTFFDVIGHIVSFRPLETSNPVPSKHYIKLTLSNIDYFLKLNIWNGIGEAKSHFEVTKLFINSDIYEINEFKNKLKCHDNFGITEKSITTLQSYSSSYTDDFKGNFPLKTVCEITEPIKEMKFLLVASIVNIRQNLPWYYEACKKCGKKIIPVPKANHSYTNPEGISETMVVECTNAQCKKSDNKLPTVELIDPIISAEIPDRIDDPELYSLVNEFMVHGPCGAENMNCPCMVDKRCSKNFPKQFSNHSSVDQNGFPLYTRRNDGHFVEKSGVRLDNRNVVPYNKYLLKRYQTHINIEWCNQGSSIKYLFKYINKGPDRATVAVVPTNNECENNDAVDEIAEYYDCRYLSACQASWRIFTYDVHCRYPSVVRLPFHLPNQQQIVYGEDDDIDDVLDKPSVAASKFTAWMESNAINSEARKLTYVEFPTKFVWILNGRFWKRRKVGKAIGRIHFVSPKLGEAYFLRILLNKVKGPTSFDDIRTVNGQTHSSFRDACYALGLLDDDKEYIDAIKEASHSGSGFYLRFLFATLLMCNSMSKPEVVWENTWEYLADGILYRQRQRFKSADVESVSSSNNRLITEELDYDVPVIKNDYDRMFLALTNEQRNIFLNIMSVIQENKGGVFFVYGYGGTGKTFLWKTIYAAIRSEGNIVLNVASSGIASLLLPGGRTAHSRFIIPFELTEDSFCNINPDGELTSLIRKTSLIIWDEAPMVHKHAFEALDRTLKDLLRCVNLTISNIPFGGKVIVFGGDFRQILLVVPGGSRQNIVNASLSSSYLWEHCKVHRLTKNMRLTVGRDQSDLGKIRDFANWLLDIGEGKLGGPNDGETIIDILDDILINDSYDPIGSLIEFVYPSILENYSDINYFQERAILAPKNEVVQEINDRLLKKFPGDEVEYLSSDSICESEFLHDQFDANLYSPDVLNGLKVSGLPNHKLVLKIGVPVMLLRNIDKKNNLCNGTRLQVLSLGKCVIERV